MSDEQAITIAPSITAAEFKNTRNDLIKFVKSQLKEAKNIANGESGDYGVIPYTKKMSLLKPGAEKLLKLFGFTAKMELVKEIEDFPNKLVLYKYRCVITHAASGTFIADAIRSCNNREKKHASKDVYDVANTVESIAQKRALVAATVQATMASEIFDADVSENDDVAPNRTVTEEEDPHRNNIFSSLYGNASRRGMSNEWLHAAAKKKFNVDSLKDLSNTQLEELRDGIIEYYEEVATGEKPKRYTVTPIVLVEEAVTTPTEVVEKLEDIFGEVTKIDEVPKAEVFYCVNKNCTKGEDGKKAIRKDPKESVFCSEECKASYE